MTWLSFAVALLMASGGPPGRGGGPVVDAPATIVVLDFVNRNPADGRDWLGKGLADMVITDLSASQRLSVVDRQRVQDLARELELGAAGILDPKTAPRIGQVARVRWVLLGTFLYEGPRLGIEALLIDAVNDQTVRIEQVEGPAGELFDLEQSLVRAILAKLDVPMTEDELRVVRLLKTQSLPAFEHYARSLSLFDGGQWFDALREARLARRADPVYLAAAIRVAQLFYEVGEPEHALTEYRRFVQQDRSNRLPAEVYLSMGKILEQAFADRAGAIAVFQQLVRRGSQYDRPFRITDPPQPSRGWDEYGGLSRGIVGVDAVFQEHKASLEALERLARWQLEAGEEAEAARLYGQLWHFLNTHGMPLGAGSVGTGFHTKVLEKYGPLYWRWVLEDRDAALYPPTSVHLLPAEGAAVGPETPPTHGYCKWRSNRIWLAPPDREIAEVSFSLEDDGSPGIKAMKGKAIIDFMCMGFQSILMKQPQVAPDGAWHSLKLDPGIRALHTYTNTDRWQVKFTLRPWSQPVKFPVVGSFQVNFLPDVADLSEPTGRYEVEVRWPDGRRRSAAFDIVEGRRSGMLLNADLNTLSRQVLASEGSDTCLLTDRAGRIWLVWDQACRDGVYQVSLESSLFCATSRDGVQWSRPRRLPVSSLDCDTSPVLQQDRQGVFWLVWVSSRDSQAPKSLWIASSPNGVEWSFPRKVVLPETEEHDLARWRESHLPRPAFAIDAHNVFWLVWQGWLMRSKDTHRWQVDSLLETGEKGTGADNFSSAKGYHLSPTSDGLLLVASFSSADAQKTGPMLWRRRNLWRWEELGYISQPPNVASSFTAHAGSTAKGTDGTILTVTQDNRGLWLREFMADGSQSEPLCVASHLTRPFHPSVAALPDGRFLVA